MGRRGFRFHRLGHKIIKKLFLLVLGVIIFLMGRIGFTFKDRMVENRRNRTIKIRDHSPNDLQLCVVCTDNPKQIILLPCGHVCLCQHCSENIHDNCPICRERIEYRTQAFIT